MKEASVVTASSVISFVERLEDNSSAFYEELADRYDEGTETFLDFARGGQKNKKSIVQTYRETVTDALETGFSFQGLDFRDYATDTDLAEDTSFEEALIKALELEEQAVAFYRDVAERSRSLLATIPMAFKSAAKRRERRKAKLEAIHESASDSL
jgi:hypothetical protein